MKRRLTTYPGVFYREAERIGGPGKERVYYILFKQDGKLLEEKVGRQYVDNMTPAKAARIRAERIEGKRLSRKEIREAQKAVRWTIDALWEDYKIKRSDIKGLQKDESRYKCDIKPYFENREPKDLVALDFDRLRLRLSKEHAPATVRNVLELLRRIINYGVKQGYVDPIKIRLTLPSVNNQLTEDLNAQELKRLLTALDKDEDQICANLMRLALYTGMRRGEILQLRWEDIDFERGFIHIRDPKGGKDQAIPMNYTAREVLQGHPRGDGVWLFPGRMKGHHAVDMRNSIARIIKAAGLPKDFRPLHGLRHVYASMLASSGEVDMYTLQKLLTHKSPQMTQRYAHLRDDAMKRAADLAGKLISEATKKADENKETKEGQFIKGDANDR
jgi:integrase